MKEIHKKPQAKIVSKVVPYAIEAKFIACIMYMQKGIQNKLRYTEEKQNKGLRDTTKKVTYRQKGMGISSHKS